MDFSLKDKPLADLDFYEFCEFLEKNGDIKKAKFDSKIIKTKLKIYGLSADKTAKICKYLLGVESDILLFPSDICYEVTLLQGLVVARREEPFKEKKKALGEWVKHIENWALCDLVIPKIKCAKNERESLFCYGLRLMSSSEEFSARCGVVIMLGFLDEAHTERIFSSLNCLEYGRYYVDMAVAWLCATALIELKDLTLDFLNNSQKINDFTYIKSLQKARESCRIPVADKEEYKSLIKLRRSK